MLKSSSIMWEKEVPSSLHSNMLTASSCVLRHNLQASLSSILGIKTILERSFKKRKQICVLSTSAVLFCSSYQRHLFTADAPETKVLLIDLCTPLIKIENTSLVLWYCSDFYSFCKRLWIYVQKYNYTMRASNLTLAWSPAPPHPPYAQTLHYTNSSGVRMDKTYEFFHLKILYGISFIICTCTP